MVWKALTFESDSDLARRIRKAALERGGQLSGAAIPECDTTFQTSEHTMTQTFGSRVKIVANTKNGLILVYVDDKLEREVSHLTVTEFMKLQKKYSLLLPLFNLLKYGILRKNIVHIGYGLDL